MFGIDEIVAAVIDLEGCDINQEDSMVTHLSYGLL